MTNHNRILASFRDPSGFIFKSDGVLYRQINHLAQVDYDLLMASGLYQKLVDKGLLVAHQEVELALGSAAAYKVIKPELVPLITYPYEWCFSQLQDAALATLKIQQLALEHNLSLKDASSFNIQFKSGRPVLIDTLSFEKYEEGKPWVAYKQFCEHFLAPLSVMAYTDDRLGRLAELGVDGLPLDLAVKLLPLKAKIHPGLLLHLVAHANNQKRYADTALAVAPKLKFSRQSLAGLLDSLVSTTRALSLGKRQTVWTDYCDDETCESYEQSSLAAKKQLVADYLAEVKPATVCDLGANAGLYSRLAASTGSQVISTDFDITVIEQTYRKLKANGTTNILPLLLDVTNPTPAIGWHNQERPGILERLQVDLVMALALVHHLAVAKNVPLDYVARQMAEMGQYLIIEFVPKEDKQTQRLLQGRDALFPTYTKQDFETAFGVYFDIKKQAEIPDSVRTLYLMAKK
jgi:ribosomal protein L11 methylase PrmA